MNAKGLFCGAVIFFGVLAATAQEKVISLTDVDRYYQQSEKASSNWPWSVRTTVLVGETPKGTWEDYSRSYYTVVPPDRSHLVYLSGRKGEFLQIGPLSYSKAEDGEWTMSNDTIKGPLVSPNAVRRFGDGVISYTESRTGDTIVVTVISRPFADADPLDPRTRTYISYFAADLDIEGRRGKITGDESIIHDGDKWVRTTNIYTFNPNIRIQSPEEEVAARPVPVPVSKEAAGSAADEPLRILSKPRPGYTDDARSNSVQGSVVLKVTFEADGTIGPIEVVKGLERGLTEATEEAARKITFTPARKNGVPVSVTRQIEYHFSFF